MKDYPSQEQIRVALTYDPATGAFVWRDGRPRAGQAAGHLSSQGYIVITMGEARYFAHVLAWIYVHGFRPDLIDHADGDPANNKLTNLRIATHAQNRVNSKRNNNATMPRGVSVDSRCTSRPFRAYIRVGRKDRYLGSFPTAEEASSAYASAAKAAYGEFVRAR